MDSGFNSISSDDCKVHAAPDATFRVSWSSTLKKRCYRMAGDPRSPHIWGSHDICLVPRGTKSSACNVYRVWLGDELVARWPKQRDARCYHVIATNFEAVKDYCRRRYGRIADRHSGLARTTLGKAMSEISTREKAKSDNLVVDRLANGRFRITKGGFGLQFSGESYIRFEDQLVYSGEALNGITLETAMQKAANSTAGMLNRIFENRGFEKRIETPFPEIAHK